MSTRLRPPGIRSSAEGRDMATSLPEPDEEPVPVAEPADPAPEPAARAEALPPTEPRPPARRAARMPPWRFRAYLAALGLALLVAVALVILAALGLPGIEGRVEARPVAVAVSVLVCTVGAVTLVEGLSAAVRATTSTPGLPPGTALATAVLGAVLLLCSLVLLGYVVAEEADREQVVRCGDREWHGDKFKPAGEAGLLIAQLCGAPSGSRR
jgi:hypothetical protein